MLTPITDTPRISRHRRRRICSPLELGLGLDIARLPDNIGGSPWSPASLGTKLKLWFDASDASTVFQDVAGTVPATNGTTVARINDKSGGARNATQATVGKRPLLTTAGINSLAVLVGDGVSQELAGGAVPYTLNDGATTAGVVRVDGTTSTVQEFFAAQPSNNIQLRNSAVGTSPAAAAAGAILSGGTTALGVAYTTAIDFDDVGNSAYYYLNGALTATGTGTATNTFSVTSFGLLGLPGSLFGHGSVGEVIFCTPRMTAAELTSWQAYAKSKWGTPLFS